MVNIIIITLVLHLLFVQLSIVFSGFLLTTVPLMFSLHLHFRPVGIHLQVMLSTCL